MNHKNYIYALLDPRKPVNIVYNDILLEYEPFYIGIGIDKRMFTHGSPSDCRNNNIKVNIIKAIRREGFNLLRIKLYSGLSRCKAKQEEIDAIKFFGRIIERNGCLSNISEGGDNTNANSLGGKNIHHKEVFQYNLKGKFIKKWKGLRAIGRNKDIKVNYNTIGDACRSNEVKIKNFSKAGDYIWFYSYKGEEVQPYKKITGQEKKVIKYCLKTLEKVNEFDSGVEAGLDVGSTKHTISKSINHKVKYKENIYSHNPLTKEELKYIQKKYIHYIVKGEVFLELKDVALRFNMDYKKLKGKVTHGYNIEKFIMEVHRPGKKVEIL